MAYQFLEPSIVAPEGTTRVNTAPPDIYMADALSPARCKELARTILQMHEEGLSWESRTRYAPGNISEWDVNQRFRSSRNISPKLPGLCEAYAAMDREAASALSSLGLDPHRCTLAPVDEQCLIYVTGDHISDHADDSASEVDEHGDIVWHLIKPNRHIVCVMWLTRQTDDGAGELEFAGGELRFNSLVDVASGEPLTVRPAPGKLVVFPGSAWFRHEVLPVVAGVRLALTRWWEVRFNETTHAS